MKRPATKNPREEGRVPPPLFLRWVHQALGLSLALSLFYLLAHYAWKLPFPTVRVLFTITSVVFLGTLLGLLFARVWPLPPQPGWERVVRTILLVIPALGIGLFLQAGLAPRGERAYYLIFALSAWLGSGLIVGERRGRA